MRRRHRPPATPVLEVQDSPSHTMASYFSGWRGERLERRRPADASAAPRSRAIVTIVHNEPVFLPIWLRYYSRFFAADDIYVLDNGTTDGSTERDGFVRLPVANDAVDHEWMVRTVEDLQHALLDRYDVVLVTDVDEIVSPVPEWGTLGQYLDRFDEEWVNCLGYEILHLPAQEPAIDLDRPILDQRQWWFPNDAYDKAALATVPMSWRTGFHGRTDFHFNGDPDLRLIHLHRMDYEICLERHRTRGRRRWTEHDLRAGWAAHNRITDQREFERWFHEDSNVAGIEVELEPIRATWRGVV